MPPTTLEWFGTATFRVRHAGLDLFFDAYLDRLPGLDPVGLSHRPRSTRPTSSS